MDTTERRIRSLLASLAAAVLIAVPAALAAQDATEPEEPEAQQEQETRTPRGLPQVTGTVLRWNGYRIDLKTPEGETQVAVNEETERLVEIEPGAEITVDYRRKIGDFVIAERVGPVETADEETGTVTAASP